MGELAKTFLSVLFIILFAVGTCFCVLIGAEAENKGWTKKSKIIAIVSGVIGFMSVIGLIAMSGL